MSEEITTRCPTCGGQTIFIGSGGHLTCSMVTCRNPSVEDAMLRAKAIEQILSGLVDNAGGYDKSVLRVVIQALRHPEWFNREYLAVLLDQAEVQGRQALADPQFDARTAMAVVR